MSKRFAVYYRFQNHGNMMMEPITADSPEEAEAKFKAMYDVYEYVQYWVCTEHLKGIIK